MSEREGDPSRQELLIELRHYAALKTFSGNTNQIRKTLKKAIAFLQNIPPDMHHCYRCGRLLAKNYLMNDKKQSWHMLNLAPNAASGGVIAPVCDKCDPMPTVSINSQNTAGPP